MKRRYIVRSYFSPRKEGMSDCICCPEPGWHRSYHTLHSEIDERLTGDGEAHVELPSAIMRQLPDGHLIEVTVRDLGMSDPGKARRADRAWHILAYTTA